VGRKAHSFSRGDVEPHRATDPNYTFRWPIMYFLIASKSAPPMVVDRPGFGGGPRAWELTWLLIYSRSAWARATNFSYLFL
jgi:hypothetical protein